MFKATAVRSPLPVMSPILPCPPCLPQGGGVWGQGVQGQGGPGGGRGVGGGGWGRGFRGRGRGHFIHLAIYCTTTWCFALKGLRTMIAEASRPNRDCLCCPDCVQGVIQRRSVHFPRCFSFKLRLSCSGYECEPHNNPPDFFLDVLNGESSAVKATRGKCSLCGWAVGE